MNDDSQFEQPLNGKIETEYFTFIWDCVENITKWCRWKNSLLYRTICIESFLIFSWFCSF